MRPAVARTPSTCPLRGEAGGAGGATTPTTESCRPLARTIWSPWVPRSFAIMIAGPVEALDECRLARRIGARRRAPILRDHTAGRRGSLVGGDDEAAMAFKVVGIEVVRRPRVTAPPHGQNAL